MIPDLLIAGNLKSSKISPRNVAGVAIIVNYLPVSSSFKNTYNLSTSLRAQGVRRKKLRLDLMLGLLKKQLIFT